MFTDSESQGLTWGFDGGERLYFKETHSNISNSSTTWLMSFNFYITTNNSYTIPDPLTYFPFARGEPFFYNDTPMGVGYLSYAVPIGNWGLLGASLLSLSSGYYDSIDIIDDETIWGFQTTKNLTIGMEIRKSIFSKTDGVLVLFYYDYVHDFGTTSRTTIESTSPPFIVNYLLLIATGSVVFIGLIIVFFFRKYHDMKG